MAHNIGEAHVCDPLMRFLKTNYDKKQRNAQNRKARKRN